jgi:hypothetical protein
MGLTECVKNELLHPYPIMTEKKGDVVAQFKYTVAVRKEGPFILSGLTIDPSKFQSEHTIDDAEINEKLKVTKISKS